MKNRTKLNILLLATLLLSPMAYAEGAQANPASSTENGVVSVLMVVSQTSGTTQETAAVSRTVLQRIDLETRQAVLNSLRDSGFMAAVMQAAAPVLGMALQLNPTSR